MVDKIEIKNFKSIRHLEMPCRKVNIFIGEPNTGKTNIIEGLAFFSPNTLQHLKEIIRLNSVDDLFYDNLINEKISIDADKYSFKLKFSGRFEYSYTGGSSGVLFKGVISREGNLRADSAGIFPFRFYQFNSKAKFDNEALNGLSTPYGDNLVSLLLTNKELRTLVSDLIKTKGYKLQLKPIEKEILIAKEVSDDIYSYPYNNISDTLRRIIFFMMVLETNKNVTLLFDEPEANTFPFYTKYLAERIALDETNQYFFTTHNPYLLRSVAEKTKIKDLNVCITYMENYETKLRILNDDELSKLLDEDIFFNLNYFLEEK